jgi:hypothetical protein
MKVLYLSPSSGFTSGHLSSFPRIQGLLILVIVITFLCVSGSLSAQEITEENYLKADTLLWEQYERDMERISQTRKAYPEKKDSLREVANTVLELALKKNRELAIRYAAVPSGLQRLFMLRLDIPKDTLMGILQKLPDAMRASPYGKNLLFHLQSQQIARDDTYYDFQSTTSEGADFQLSSLYGKNILLLYGGLGCMGRDGREYLNALYAKTDRDTFEIVVYECVSDQNQLSRIRTMYAADFLLVSDFLQDASPVKILYGAQATPTCFFIDKEGIVRMKTVGLYTDRVDELLAP